jgi:hypothetical protein
MGGLADLARNGRPERIKPALAIQIVNSIFANWRVMSHFRQVHGAVGL